MRLLKQVLSISVLIFIVACSTQPKPTAHRASVKKIAIIAATNPLHYNIKNENAIQLAVPLAGTATYLDSKKKADIFTQRLITRPSSLGEVFTDNVANSLRNLGYQVSILDIARQADDPDDVEYENVSTTADAILHLKFNEVGLYSSMISSAYIPRIEVSAVLFFIENGEEVDLFDQEIIYGADTAPGRSRAIPVDNKFAYPTFEAALQKIDEVSKAFEIGALEIGKLLPIKLHDAIK